MILTHGTTQNILQAKFHKWSIIQFGSENGWFVWTGSVDVHLYVRKLHFPDDYHAEATQEFSCTCMNLEANSGLNNTKLWPRINYNLFQKPGPSKAVDYSPRCVFHLAPSFTNVWSWPTVLAVLWKPCSRPLPVSACFSLLWSVSYRVIVSGFYILLTQGTLSIRLFLLIFPCRHYHVQN